MPRNPSPKQVEASRANLVGHYGPKTSQGRQKVAKNGERNKGVKSAKARARVIHGRWGALTGTFYSWARCAECRKTCIWPSFSVKTSHDSLPLRCLENVLTKDPNRCFYYFEGLCCVPSDGKDVGMGSRCILDTSFLDMFRNKGSEARAELVGRELSIRRKTVALKAEMSLYTERMRSWGPDALDITPRMKYVMRHFQNLLRVCAGCRLETWRARAGWDDVLEWIAETDI